MMRKRVSSWLEKSGWGERLFCGRATFSRIRELENSLSRLWTRASEHGSTVPVPTIVL